MLGARGCALTLLIVRHRTLRRLADGQHPGPLGLPARTRTLLDAAVGSQVVAADSNPDRVALEGRSEPPNGIRPRRADCIVR